MRRIFCTLVSAILLFNAGCVYDHALQRELSIVQFSSTKDNGETFDVDTSKLPSNWIENNSTGETPSGKVTHIRISQGHPVKILIVPILASAPLEGHP